MRTAGRLVTVSAALALALGPLPHPLAAQVAPPAPETTSSAASAPATRDPFPGATAAAVAVNVVRIPGKTMLCGLGTLAAATMLLGTFGTQYRAAGAVFREGCGGKWVIGASDLERNVDAPKAVFSGESY